MFKHLRSVLSHSRVPIKVASAGSSNVYRIRFVKRRENGAGRFLTLAVTGGINIFLGFQMLKLLATNDQPVFIPLGFAKQDPPQRFKKDDPEVKAFIKFGTDRTRARKARSVFEDKTIQVLKSSLPEKLGTQIKSVHSMLYFHYPQGPLPGYSQKGLHFTYRPVNPAAIFEQNRRPVIEINYGERQMKLEQYLQKESILYPQWMFQAIKNSVRDIWADITSPRDLKEDEKIEDVSDIIQYGVDFSQWALSNLKDDLKKTRLRMSPPSGHVIIDGLVEVLSNNALIIVDLTGSFNPENPEQAVVHRMAVRFASRVKPPVVVKKIIIDANKALELSKVVSMKEAVKTLTKTDDKSYEILDKTKALVEKRSEGGKEENGPDIIGRLVESNTRVEKKSERLATKEGKGRIEDSDGDTLRHKPREDTPLKKLDSSAPSTPESQQPHPPRE